ncbi:exported protein of unknown function [Legionella hackeliae]|uniref:Uncharacterized protein n=1 Tax=Legionella hackeliae TaxID=449 RepID=A0A0A8UX81_LEGHA|nr:exported protein of unknown function [Legionella hackeliae]
MGASNGTAVPAVFLAACVVGSVAVEAEDDPEELVLALFAVLEPLVALDADEFEAPL